MKTNLLKLIKTILLALVLSVGIAYVYASWSGPTQSPPNNGNVYGPLNTGPAFQTKTGNGALTIGELSAPYLGPWASSGGRLVLNSGVLKIDLTCADCAGTVKNPNPKGRDAIFINSSSDNKTSTLIVDNNNHTGTNGTAFQFWSTANSDQADIIGRDSYLRDEYVFNARSNNKPICAQAADGKLVVCP